MSNTVAAYFMPFVTTLVAVAAVWRLIYHPNYVLINGFLEIFGIGPQKWLADPKQAMLAIIIVSVWSNMGYNMVIYLAGLQGIPREFYEAAKIDGANRWTIIRMITWPLLMPTTFFILVTSIIRSMQVFTTVHTMTEGGPVNATNVLVYYLYEKAFQSFRIGYAFSIAYVLFIMIFILTLINWSYARKRMEVA